MRALDYILSSTEKKRKVSDKEILRKIRILVPARGADLKPPLGPTLGQFGINIKDFCDKFNSKTKNYEEDIMLNVHIILFVNKTYSFIVKTPPIFFLANEDDFFEDSFLYPKYIFFSTFYKIVKLKSFDNQSLSLESIANSIIGTLLTSKIIFVNDIFN
jgi:large subunit ribosomal protein L11